jgi:succinylglutamate desuccinylase
MRDWLSFTTERVRRKSLAIVMGIAGHEFPEQANPFVRPLSRGSSIRAHIHAAIFNYQPVQRGELPFAGIISKIITSSNPNALMHLMVDTRPYDGVGETDLARGACWMGPIKTFNQG